MPGGPGSAAGGRDGPTSTDGSAERRAGLQVAVVGQHRPRGLEDGFVDHDRLGSRILGRRPAPGGATTALTRATSAGQATGSCPRSKRPTSSPAAWSDACTAWPATSQVVWSATGSNAGWSRESLSGVAQKLLRELLSPLGRG